VLKPGVLAGLQAGKVSWAPGRYDTVDLDDAGFFFEPRARLEKMDEQGMDAAILFPTLGIAWKRQWTDNDGAIYANVRSFNRWVQDQWGFALEGRLFGAAILSLQNPEMATAEAGRLVDEGVRVVDLDPGLSFGRSPGDPVFDRLWGLLADAKVLVAFHVTGDSRYHDELPDVGARPTVFQDLTAFQWLHFIDRPIMDTLAALVLHNVFGRFPDLRVLSAENGSGWVSYLLRRMDMAAVMGAHAAWMGGKLADLPSEIFRRHVYVAPYPDEDVASLIELLDVSQVVLGTDYPHPEGHTGPELVLSKISHLGPYAVSRVMGENTADALNRGQPVLSGGAK
jgi:predicted TIM-barrel fold metal-dependent hydrolase